MYLRYDKISLRKIRHQLHTVADWWDILIIGIVLYNLFTQRRNSYFSQREGNQSFYSRVSVSHGTAECRIRKKMNFLHLYIGINNKLSRSYLSILLATIPTQVILASGVKCTILQESVAYGCERNMKWGDTQANYASKKHKNLKRDFCIITRDHTATLTRTTIQSQTTKSCVQCQCYAFLLLISHNQRTLQWNTCILSGGQIQN